MFARFKTPSVAKVCISVNNNNLCLYRSSPSGLLFVWRRKREIREFKEFREFRESDQNSAALGQIGLLGQLGRATKAKISRRAAVLKVLFVPDVLAKARE